MIEGKKQARFTFRFLHQVRAGMGPRQISGRPLSQFVFTSFRNTKPRK